MKKTGNWRIGVLAGCVMAVGGAIVLRLFFIQIRGHELYRLLAEQQHGVAEQLLPKRGTIFFQDRSKRAQDAADISRVPAATQKQGYLAYAIPRLVPKDSAEPLSQQLASLLGLDAIVIRQRLEKRSDPYEPLKRKLTDAQAGAMEQLGVPGIKLAAQIWRQYPAGDLAGSLIGYVNDANEVQKGLYGIERAYDAVLAGKAGYRSAERDALGGFIPFRIREERPVKDGSSLVLTVDANIQFMALEKLRATLKKWKSPGGTMIVLEPTTGKIFAMVSEPSFDPNTYNEVRDVSVFLNSAVERVFEPGSVFKPITMAAGLEEKLVTPATTYHDEGIVHIGGYNIQNFDGKAYGARTMTEVIELSLNTGVVHVERLLGKDRFTSYVEKFGFGEKLGVDLPGELKGSIQNLHQKAEVNFATASFGQGISVTPLQMANAIAAIANGGNLMRPYAVERIVHADGTVEIVQPNVVRRVLSIQAAKDMTRMMVDAVRGKFERRADVPGYFVAGKTGTAQIPNPDNGGYLPVTEGVIHSFVGFAPAFSPRFLVFIKMDKPVGVQFAANSLTPLFHDMAVYLLNYFNVPPDEAVQ